MTTQLEYDLAREVLEPKPNLRLKLKRGRNGATGVWLYVKHKVDGRAVWSFANVMNPDKGANEKVVMLVRLTNQDDGLISMSSRFFQRGYPFLPGNDISNLISKAGIPKLIRRFFAEETSTMSRWFAYEKLRVDKILNPGKKNKTAEK